MIDSTGDGQTDGTIDLERVEAIYQQGEDAVFCLRSGREVTSKKPKSTEVQGMLVKIAARSLRRRKQMRQL